MATIVIAVDAMGGDFGPRVTVPASLQILHKYPDVKLVLVGDNAAIDQELKAIHSGRTLYNKDNLTIHHTTEQVEMDELPSHALRAKKDSSMRVAINLVKEKQAQACVSAGNTGALMATARFVLKTLPGIDRPAIMASLPTRDLNKEVRMLDLGANVDSSADHLYQFAVMGSVVASAIDNIAQPKVALLNIGEEEIKGNDQVKQTAHLLSQSKAINYMGYIEGDAIFSGVADVVVADGFVGNVALKSTEGVAKLVAYYMKRAFHRNLLTRMMGLIAKPALSAMAKNLDPSRRNGASLLGLQGIVIKSHGGAQITAFTYAIEKAIREIENNIPERIHREVAMVLKENHIS